MTAEVDTRGATVKLGRLDAATMSALRGEIASITGDIKEAVLKKLTGAVLYYRTGDLYTSVRQEMRENAARGYIYGRVYVDPKIKYAAIHEYGGVIKHPGSNKFQAWFDQNKPGPTGWTYTHFTRPHDIPMPQRSYMRSTLEEMRAEIVSRLTEAAKAGARSA
jgi:phage gpG-like protein